MKLTSLCVAATALLFAAGGAEAMPAPSLSATGDSGFILARQGCGFGAHQGYYGGCRLNHGWRGRMRGAMGGAPLGCRPGTHPRGRGYCVRNRY